MKLKGFLNNLFKNDGFILVDANSREHVIGKPKKINPIKIKNSKGKTIKKAINLLRR